MVATVVSELTDTFSLLNFLLQGTTRRKNKMVTLPKTQVEASLITNCQISEVFFGLGDGSLHKHGWVPAVFMALFC